MKDIASKKGAMDSVVVDAIREKAFFSKQTEGNPAYFSELKESGTKLGLHTDSVGLLDFYESFSIFPRVNAAMN